MLPHSVVLWLKIDVITAAFNVIIYRFFVVDAASYPFSINIINIFFFHNWFKRGEVQGNKKSQDARCIRHT